MQIPHYPKEYIFQWSNVCLLELSFSILFQCRFFKPSYTRFAEHRDKHEKIVENQYYIYKNNMKQPVQFDWISGSFRFPWAGFIQWKTSLQVRRRRGWSTGSGGWSTGGLWDPQSSKILWFDECIMGAEHTDRREISSSDLGWNGLAKIQARWPNVKTSRKVSLGKCTLSYGIFVTFPFFEDTSS